MSEADAPTTHRVRVRNHAEAPQGVYEAKAPLTAGQKADIMGGGQPATYIKPGESKVLVLDEATVAHLRDHPTIFSVFAADAAEPADAAAPLKADDATEDVFDKMSDEEIRGFLVDRGQKPHQFLGRPKLLSMARAPADAKDADGEAETV